jgi:hypothetical protein
MTVGSKRAADRCISRHAGLWQGTSGQHLLISSPLLRHLQGIGCGCWWPGPLQTAPESWFRQVCSGTGAHSAAAGGMFTVAGYICARLDLHPVIER